MTTTHTEASIEDATAFMARYRPLTVEEIDPSFIHMNPAVMERSHFEAQEEYVEPVEPRIIDAFDHRAQARATIEAADAFVSEIAGRLERQETLYDKIFEVMRSKRFRAGTMKQTQFEDNREIFRPLVEERIAEDTPLEFVLPSFPFKHNNPVKVGRRTPDMAEVLCLCQIYSACHALGSVYEPGARFTIIGDGMVYREMFGITEHEASVYRERTQSMIDELGFGDKIELADMADLVAEHREVFDFVEKRLRPVFAEWWASHPDDLRLQSLIAASTANLNTSDAVTDDLVQLATMDVLLETDKSDAGASLETIKAQTVRRGEEGAFEFALFLYVLNELDLVSTCYPRAVRATVHPKPRQWGLHLVSPESRVFPWQGVAYRNVNDRWRIKYEIDMRRERAIPVHVRGDDEMYPFYYQAAGDDPEQ